MNSNINLKNLLIRIWDAKQAINEIYDWVKHGLGDDAEYIRDWADLKRVERDGTDADEIEGDSLFDEVLQYIWKSGKDYIWHYKGQRFRITPFKNGTTDDGGFIFYFGEKHSLVTFAGVVRDAVDTDTDLWDAIVARMFGIADGYASASKLMHVCAEMPAPDAEVAEDLKWKDGYGVDPAEAVKVPEGAVGPFASNGIPDEPGPDGTLACADPEPCPEEVPVIDQAEEPVPKPKKNWKEKRASEKDLIRAGGGPLPDGNSDMTDEEKEGYRRWKQSLEVGPSPERYG